MSLREGAEISYSFVNGSPQCGIKAGSDTKVHHNFIRLNSKVTNGYGVQGYRTANVQIYNNRIINTNGRGIHLSEKGAGWRVHDNIVETRETANSEYKKGLYTHGIKMETTQNSVVYNNAVLTVTTPTSYCTTLNLAVRKDSNNLVINNVFVAIDKFNNKFSSVGSAFFPLECDGSTTPVIRNTFISDQWAARIPGETANNLNVRQCDFQKVSPTDKTKGIWVYNYRKVAKSNRFVNCRFDGIDMKDYRFPRQTPGRDPSWRRKADYAIAHSLSLTVTDGGKPLAEATISAKSDNGLSATATTNATGKAELDLANFTVFYDPTAKAPKLVEAEMYTVTITAGEKTRTFKIAPPTAAMAATVAIEGKGEIKTTPVKLVIGADAAMMAKDAFWRARVAANLAAKPGEIPAFEAVVHVGPLSPFKPVTKKEAD